jgi:hypothetical protein
MDRRDEGPFDTVGWGPFALPGERKRLREAEQRRIAEVERLRAGRSSQAVDSQRGAEVKDVNGNPSDEARPVPDDVQHQTPTRLLASRSKTHNLQIKSGDVALDGLIVTFSHNDMHVDVEVDQQTADELRSHPDLLKDPVSTLDAIAHAEKSSGK